MPEALTANLHILAEDGDYDFRKANDLFLTFYPTKLPFIEIKIVFLQDSIDIL